MTVVVVVVQRSRCSRPHTTICVPILLYVCPHTTVYMSLYFYMRVLTVALLLYYFTTGHAD
jgi:hypothetical protein